MSDHLRRERHDLHEPLLAQLATHRPEDARGAGLALIGDEHRGVLVEPDVGAVLAPRLLRGAHDHGLHHLALLDLPLGMASLIVTPTMSPRPPERRFGPPRPRIPGALPPPELFAVLRFLLRLLPSPPPP